MQLQNALARWWVGHPQRRAWLAMVASLAQRQSSPATPGPSGNVWEWSGSSALCWTALGGRRISETRWQVARRGTPSASVAGSGGIPGTRGRQCCQPLLGTQWLCVVVEWKQCDVRNSVVRALQFKNALAGWWAGHPQRPACPASQCWALGGCVW